MEAELDILKLINDINNKRTEQIFIHSFVFVNSNQML